MLLLWPTLAGAATTGNPLAPEGRALVTAAQSYLGVRYVWGGNDAHGFDCSGFVAAVYQAHGYRLPRVSRQQALVGTAIHTLPLSPGDLLFFAEIPGSTRVTHVAMSIGGLRFIHAALGKGEVTYDSLDENYYARRWLGARRVLDLLPGNYATKEGMAPAAAALPAHVPIAPQVAAKEAPKDMLQEHPERALPGPLEAPQGRSAVFETGDDPFSGAILLPQETGGGLRAGHARLLGRHAFFLQPEARFFGHASSLQLDVAAPFLWPVSGEGRHLPGSGVSWHSARDWGRLLRTLTYGRRDARFFFGLERAMAITLGDGVLMRHFMPNGQSAALEDLLAQPSDLTATLVAQTNGFELTWVLDDILAPQVTGVNVRSMPTELGSFALSRRLGVTLAWAMDHEAPYRELAVANEPITYKAVHLGDVGLTYLLSDARLVARAYVSVAGRIANTRPVKGALGGTFGLLASLAAQPGLTPAGHRLSLRLEMRLGGPGFRANYMPFSYAQNRVDAPYRNSHGSTFTGEMPQLTLLLAQSEQPRHISGMVELTYNFSGRIGAGLSYEDGGSLGAEMPGPVPIDRNLTAYVMGKNIPLGLHGHTLRGRFLWHWSAAEKLWPLVDATRPHSFLMALVRADITHWLDAGISVRKPLGHSNTTTRAIVGTADVSAHFAY